MRTAALRALVLGCVCLPLLGCTDDTSKRKADAGDNASGGGNPDALAQECSDSVPCPPTGKACVLAVCNSGVCQMAPAADGTACDDQQACTEGDTCQDSTCAGAPKVCDDGLTCSKDSCDESMGGCVADVSTCACTKDADCDDKNACTGLETCDPVARTCLNGVKVSCAALDNGCNVGMCNPTNGTCTALPKPSGTACSDGNACTQNDVCAEGTCAGTAITCAALDQCHVAGVCDPASGQCSNPTKANGTTCEDGNLCTRGDACVDGTCAAGPATTCTATGECHTAGTCDPATGMCSNPVAADGTSCNDGSACTNADKCAAGVCQGAPITCDDGVACTVDSCSESTGCTKDVRMCGCQKNSDCDDGNACNGAETCNVQTLTCVSGTPKDCSASTNACNVGVCNASTGACEAKPRQNGTSCSDGTACTRVDTCVDGQCKGQNPVVCTASDQCHVAGTCDAQTGACSSPPKANGASCNDGNACTQTDACQNGTCTGVNPVTCTAASQCHTVGTCNPQTGSCSTPIKANGTACNDGNACTQTDSCQSGVCGGGNPIACVAQDQCHAVGMCDAKTGVCSNPAKTNGSLCNDGNACTQTDACQAGACQGANPVVCVPLDGCHDAGVCDPSKGSCSTPTKAEGSACNDNNGCTLADKCAAGACRGTTMACTSPPVCQQGGMCVGNGTCSYQNAPDQTTCDDGQGCTLADACVTGKCTGTRRSNKSGDWNRTPAADKGLVTSVNIDNFSKGALVAGTFLGSVGFGNFTVTAVRSTGAYVALYTTDSTVGAAQLVMQASTSLVVSDITSHDDGSFVLVGSVAGGVAFPSNAKQNFATEGVEWFVAAFNRDLVVRWVRRGLRGNGLAVAADAYANRSVMVVGTCDKPLALEDGSGGVVSFNNAGTVAAVYDDDGFLKGASVVASQALLGLKVAVSPQTDLAAVQGTGVGELVIGGNEGFASLGSKDVFLFALTPDLRVLWARQMATALDDETGGVAAYPGKTGVFVSFWSGMGPKATIRGRSVGTTPLHGFDGRGLQGQLVTFNKDGTPINAALIANKSGLPVRAWDVRTPANDGRFTVVGTFNLATDVYGVAGFGDGPPTSNPDRAITHSADGNSLFAARFDSDAIKNTWAINLRGTNAGVGANGNDVTVTVHPDLSATATGMFVTSALFGDQVVDALVAGQGTFFLSHFNAAAEYDYCQ